MSLPSQTARTSPAGRSFVYRRRKSRRRPPPVAVALGVVAMVVVLASAVLIFGPGFGGPTSAVAGEGPAGEPAPVVTEPLATSGRRDVLDLGPARPASREPEKPGSGASAGRPARASSDVEGLDVLSTGLTPPPMAKDRGMLVEALDGARTSEVTTEAPAPSPSERPAPASRPVASEPTAGRITAHLEAADALRSGGDLLAARQALWDAMAVPGLDETELRVLRDRLSMLNRAVVFEGPHRAGDRLSETYTVRPGDTLTSIARARGLSTHWRLIQRVNGLSSPERIRAGQTLKLIRGPFHAVVDKSDFRLDLYQGPPERPEEWVFVRSFEVGLGEDDSTPIGHFMVKKDGKLENPGWVNPRNAAEKYGPDDPANPIGEFWVGLEGLGDSAAYTGYGLHGTIEPDSIGRERSMGCVRLRPDDIAMMYELMGEGQSVVRVVR